MVPILTTTCCTKTTPLPPPHPQSCGGKTFAPFLLLSVLSSSYHGSPPPFASLREDTCDQRPVTWQPSQKAFMPVARQGAGIYFPRLPPVSSSRPLAPPRSLKEIHCPCFLSCLPLPCKKNNISQKRKRELPVLLSVVQAKGGVYCTPLRGPC